MLFRSLEAIGPEQSDGLISITAYSTQAEAVIIEISNNGPVIPQEMMEHIFVPFFTTKEQGSGIGLSVSRQIMRLSGGNLTAKSDQGTGLTIFSLVFP